MTSGKLKTDLFKAVRRLPNSQEWSGNTLILSFIVFNILSGTAAGILQMAIPLYALNLQADASEIGLLRGASGIGMLLAVLPAGYASDRFGWKRLFGWGTAISAATVFLFPLMNSISLLILFMGVQGMANALKFSSLNAAFFTYLNRIGWSKAGWHKGSMSIGLTFAGPMAGGMLLEVMDYSLVFTLSGLLMMVPLLFAVIGPEDERRVTNRDAESIGWLQACRRSLQGYRMLIQRHAVLRTVLIESLTLACFATFIAFAAVYVSRVHGLPASQTSWFLILEGAFFILTVFLCGGFVERYGKNRLYAAGFALSSIGLLLFSLSTHSAGLAAGTSVLGAGLGLINLVTTSQAARLPVEKGQLSGLMSFCAGIGTAWGPAAAGVIGQLWGLKLVFLSFVPLFVLAVAVLYIPVLRSPASVPPEQLPAEKSA